MARVDVHVHSSFSSDPSEWILKKLGTAESYMDVRDVYRLAKTAGMNFVTITDHNTVEGALELNREFPRDTFVGVEVTTTFPEDGCKMHLLVYDLTAEQFALVEKIRGDIYQLRDYLLKANLPYSLAHATYAVNNKLNIDVLEKCILLFDVFEGINGARSAQFNHIWTQTLQSLTPQKIDRLYRKHHIEPASRDPWVKGITGGSDDHAGLFVGKTYTCCEARTVDEFLVKMRDKKSLAQGRQNHFKSMAFSFYKIGYDFSVHEKKKKPNRLWRCVNRVIFEGRAPGLKDAYLLHRLRLSPRDKDRIIAEFVDRLTRDLLGPNHSDYSDNEGKVQTVFDHLSGLSDDFVKLFFEKFSHDLEEGEAFKLVKRFMNLFPVGLISAPFVAALKQLFGNRELLESLKSDYELSAECYEKRVMWFTDTIDDLNGVSVTLRNIARYAHENHLPVTLVTSRPGFESSPLCSPNVLNLPAIHAYTPDFYPNYTLQIPSFLKSLDLITRYNPTEVIISTPGPLGILGVLVARLLGIKCTGVFHTDFARQMDYIIGDGLLPGLFENGTRWFYQMMDEIQVPTQAYIEVLCQRGYQRDKMKIFKRGIDTARFCEQPLKAKIFLEKFNIPEGFYLLYTGRVSKDKSIDFLADVYEALACECPRMNLIIAGKGPALESLRQRFSGNLRVIFTGALDREELPGLYSLADLFVFPSTTDTFGMSVLEALSCGVPAIVSDIGGPQEIVENGKTGFVVRAGDLLAWVKKIKEIYHLKQNNPEQFVTHRERARSCIESRYSWGVALQEFFHSGARKNQESVQTREETALQVERELLDSDPRMENLKRQTLGGGYGVGHSG